MHRTLRKEMGSSNLLGTLSALLRRMKGRGMRKHKRKKQLVRIMRLIRVTNLRRKKGKHHLVYLEAWDLLSLSQVSLALELLLQVYLTRILSSNQQIPYLEPEAYFLRLPVPIYSRTSLLASDCFQDSHKLPLFLTLLTLTLKAWPLLPNRMILDPMMKM